MARFREQQAQQQTQQAQFLHDNSNQSFTNGVMHVNGAPQAPVETQNWKSSNGTTIYTTVKWQDPASGRYRTSCNCPGWAMKKKAHRECCHTKDMEGAVACTKERAGHMNTITTVADAVKLIPDIEDGRELRGIVLG